MIAHDDYKAMIPAQALGALEPGEACLLREHLADCAVCRTELETLSETVSSLALAADAAEPPAELRDRILDIIKTTPQERLERNGEETSRDNVIPFTARPQKQSSVARYLAIAASIALVAALIGLWVIWNRERQTRAEIAQINRRLSDTQGQLAREREMREMLSSPDARIAQLQGLETAPNATAKFAIDQRTGRALLIAHNLPQAPSGKAYQMWYIVDGKPLPGGVFKVDPSGNVEERETVPVEGRNALVFAVTLEPAGGVQSPTGAAYLKTPAPIS